MNNKITTQMAATNSRNNSAIKELAFITTPFLPGTFIAVHIPASLLSSFSLSISAPDTFTDNFLHWLLQLAKFNLCIFLDLLDFHHPLNHTRSVELAPLVGVGEKAPGS
jgi:hypothetical protein